MICNTENSLAAGRTSFTLDEVAEFKRAAVRGRSYADRISIQLAFRLLGWLGPAVDEFDVLLELDNLEGLRETSRTKPAAPFRKAPLCDHSLWHKHFFSNQRHLVRNVGIRWSLDPDGNDDLDKMIHEVAKDYGHDPEVWQKILAHRLIVEAYEERARRGLTGDWIIFAKHKGKNYYLDLATHTEGKEPERLLQKLRNGCSSEFPFAFQHA